MDGAIADAPNGQKLSVFAWPQNQVGPIFGLHVSKKIQQASDYRLSVLGAAWPIHMVGIGVAAYFFYNA